MVRASLFRLAGLPEDQQATIRDVFHRQKFSPRSIYVRATNLVCVSTMVRGLTGVDNLPRIDRVPDNEIDPLLRLERTSVDIGDWVRVCGGGKYRRDLAYVGGIDRVGQKATVLLVPRMSASGRQSKQSRSPPSLFEYEPSGVSLPRLDDGRIKYRGNIFREGLIERSFSIDKLRVGSPTPHELDLFGRSKAIDPSFIKKSWSQCAASRLQSGHRVRVTAGEQAGLTGLVLDVVDGVILLQLENQTGGDVQIPSTSMRLHLRVGDYVRVNFGLHLGKFGAVVDVMQQDDADLITFLDDASVATGQPEQVSAFSWLLRTNPIIFFRLWYRITWSNPMIPQLNRRLSPKHQ
jgi:ribosomal protein L24